MNVPPYGKTIKNAAKRTSIQVLTDIEKARRLAEKPQWINFRLFNFNLVAVESRKLNQVINKPFQLGFAVLEYSKFYIYRTYATLKDWYSTKMRMLYTNTNSLNMQFILHVTSTRSFLTSLNCGVCSILVKFSQITQAVSELLIIQTQTTLALSKTRLKAIQSPSLLP